MCGGGGNPRVGEKERKNDERERQREEREKKKEEVYGIRQW